MNSFSLESFKQDVQVLAIAQHWKPAQIQYAEDYIDSLVADGLETPLPQEFDPQYADLIKQLFQSAHG